LTTKYNTGSRVFDLGSLMFFKLFVVTQEQMFKIVLKYRFSRMW